MKQTKKGVISGIEFFIVHFCVEVVCFSLLYLRSGDAGISTVVALAFDIFAFFPQGIIGELFNRFRRFRMGSLGVALMCAALPGFLSENNIIFALSLMGLCLGNAILHECGAIATVTASSGRIFPSALFVAGGSFGLIVGQTLGKSGASVLWLLIPLAAIELIILLTDRNWAIPDFIYPDFGKTTRSGISPVVIIVIAFVVTAVRGFVGYAIPISWRTELWQFFVLYFTMGVGKALGGLLADRFGYKTVGVASSLLAIPFLVIGDRNMIVSVIGIMLFSMTMSITFAMLLGALPQHPGFAFGITTIALIIGSIPVLFVHFNSVVNTVLVIGCSVLCAGVMFLLLSDSNARPAKNPQS